LCWSRGPPGNASRAARASPAEGDAVAGGRQQGDGINLLLGVVVALVVAGAVVALLLVVRRRAPDGGFFHDGDRAAGMFGVLATGFSVLLGFIVFLAFASFDETRTGAETEALTVAQQFETAQFMPTDVSTTLGGELICYGRYVVGTEWPSMEQGQQGDKVNPWGVAMFETVHDADPRSSNEETAFAKWLDQTSDREQARLDRLHGAEGIIPWPLWAALVFTAVVIFGFMMFFADSGEPRLVQGVQVGSVTLVMVVLLLLIRFLDHPFQEGPGGLQPTAMERTLTLLEVELQGVGDRGALPCDRLGRPR
jgi:hypothetical protein